MRIKKAVVYILIILAVLFDASSCEHNVYIDGKVARVGKVYFRTIQEAINYACSYEEEVETKVPAKRGKVAEENTVVVLVKSIGGPGLYVPASEDNVKVDFNGCVYTVSDDTGTVLDVRESGSEVLIEDATFVIGSSNNSLEYVYRINADYQQDHVIVDDRRNVTKDNCEAFRDRQKISIGKGVNVSFGDTGTVGGESILYGWLSIGEGSVLTLKSGTYTFWGIEGEGELVIEDYVTISIFSKDKDTVNDCVQNKSVVWVIIMDDVCPHTYTHIATRDATCQKEGFIWRQCDNCGTCVEIISHSAKTDHKYSEEWDYDDEDHWHECVYCHEAIKDEAPHSLALVVDDPVYHWHVCTVCDYESEKEEHTWDENDVCTYCGAHKPEEPPGSGGFSVEIVSTEPQGTLSAAETPEGSNNWTITLTDLRADSDYKITSVKWYQDGEYVTGYDDRFEYVLTNPLPRTYFINCVISNDSGIATTLEIVVRGNT